MTFLRWAGSKKQLGDVLANCWYAAQISGGSGRYIEAFCGSASLFFRLTPASALLIDINKSLIETYDVVKKHPSKLHELLHSYPQNEDFYYSLRSADPRALRKIERAARFIYLNRFCFNGLYRTNQKGQFNVPYGAGRNGELPNLAHLREASKALKNANLYSGDFAVIQDEVREGDFVYMDPPYAKRNHSLDLQYGPDVFGVQDLARIEELMAYIHNQGAYFLFSYVDCEEISSLETRWGAHRVEVKRTIAADTSKRTKSEEVLITNI